MARGSKTTTIQERVEIGQRAEAGQKDPEIATGMGLSVWTVRKWRRRWQRRGRAGLASQMGRPSRGPLASFPSEVREMVRQLRQAHPGWGPETLRVELADEQRLGERGPVPGRSQIAAFLKQEGLTRTYERHSDLPQAVVMAPQQAHEEWEMDAKGVLRVPTAGQVSLINLCDVFSTLKVDSYPCMHAPKPALPDYQLVLRRAFLKYGLPLRLALDHDSVFYDNTSPSPYPSRGHLWLIALGVTVTFGRKGCPTDQATVERAHQTLTNQAAIQHALDDRLDFLAWRFPSRSLNHPEAVHSGRPYRPQWEWDLLDLGRVYAYLAQGRWFRQVSPQGQFSLGSYRYGLGSTWATQQIELTFNPDTQEFVGQAEDASRSVHLPAQGLTKQNLMGELGPIVALPAYQLALPFPLAEWRQMQLCADLTGTSF